MPDFGLLLRYFLVGGSTALLYFGLTIGLVEGAALHATLASMIACVAAICYNYMLHYHWTFASDAPHGKVLVRYVLMCIGAVMVNGLLMHFGMAVLSLHYVYVQLLAAVGVAIWTLSLSAIFNYLQVVFLGNAIYPLHIGIITKIVYWYYSFGSLRNHPFHVLWTKTMRAFFDICKDWYGILVKYRSYCGEKSQWWHNYFISRSNSKSS